MKDILLDIWGSTRKITQTIQYNPLEIEKRMTNKITWNLTELITEDQIDDLVEMTGFIITTLKNLQLLRG